MGASVSTAPNPAADEIRRTLAMLFAPGDVIELRAIHKGRKRVDAGYFDAEHRDALIEASEKLNGAGAAIYVTLNPLDPQLLARCANRVQEFAQATATDTNVTRRCWFLIDIDPQRPKDTSATDSQYELTRQRGRAIYAFLAERDWPKPAVAHSGNGVHLLYRIDLPNDDASRDLIKRALEALAARFDDDAVKVDRTVFNAARIVKLHGTVATKGDHVPSAPWRLSKLLSVPETIQPVSIDLLSSLAAEIATSQPKPSGSVYTGNGRAWTEPDMVAFLARGGIEATGPESHDGAQRWKLRTCPFNPDHGPGESAVFLRADGRLGFDCKHNSCADKHWSDLRALVDGPRESRHGISGSNGLPAPQQRSLSAAHDAPIIIMRRAADVEMEPVSWLWSGWLAAAKLHMLGGVPGTGKTSIALSLAAIMTSAGRWPDGTPCLKRGSVVIWSGEDDAADTLVPRLAAMRAELDRVHIVSAVTEQDSRRPFDPSCDMSALIERSRQVGDVRLLIVDPVVTVVAGDSHKNAEVRRGLAPLVEFAQELKAAVLGVTHFSKGTSGKDPLDRLTGSLAFGAAPRLVFAAAKQIADDGTEEGRVLVRVKSNIGPDGGAIGYQLATAELPQGIVTSRISWGMPLDGSARDILAEAERTDDSEDAGGALAAAEKFLHDVFADGPLAARDIYRQAREAGHSEMTIRRAKDALGIAAQRTGFGSAGAWRWALPIPKVIIEAKDAHTKMVSTNGQNEHLCTREPPAQSAGGDSEAL
jgi:putative DNA primase/helicase